MGEDSESAAALRRKTSEAATRSQAASVLAQRKHRLTAPKTRSLQCAKAAKSFWDGLSPEQRSREMRRRRRLGHLRGKKKALGTAK